jgi:2-methylcitrate dehydratase PrpD
MGVPPDWGALTEGLGDSWELLLNAYKPYPAGVVVHPVIDAVLALCAERPIEAADVARIVVRGNPLLSARTDRPHVTTGREAQVSVQHSVAVALMFGRAGIEQFTDACVRDPAVLALRAKVEVEQDPAIAVDAASASIWTTGGEEHSIMVAHARGSMARPMSDRDIEEKVASLAAGWCAGHDIRPLIDAVWALDRADDASALLGLTVPKQQGPRC